MKKHYTLLSYLGIIVPAITAIPYAITDNLFYLLPALPFFLIGWYSYYKNGMEETKE